MGGDVVRLTQSNSKLLKAQGREDKRKDLWHFWNEYLESHEQQRSNEARI